MINPKSFVWPLALLLTCTSPAHAQDQPASLSFDVATIRLSNTEDRSGFIKALPGGNGYTAKNITVKLMISLIYRVPLRQITGDPDWLNTDRYNVEAKVDSASNIDELRIMYKNLLADRFKLKMHHETKEGPVYALMLEPPGSKMKPDENPQDFRIPMTYGPNGTVLGVRVPIPYLCWWLGQQLQNSGRPVIDLTGLDKNYDFTLTFAPDLPPDASRDNQSPDLRDRPSIFEALKQQLGLKLQPQKGPIEYYVIDHVERPSDN